MTRVVYIIANLDTNQAYAGLTKRFTDRMQSHRRTKPHLFIGNHTITKTGPMSDTQAQRFEAKAVRFLQLVGFRTLNIAKPGALGGAELFWTKERCAAEALKHTTLKEFMQNGNAAYQLACRNGWLDDVGAHLIGVKKRNGFWTKERCAAEALKYLSRVEFERNETGAFKAAKRNGWLNQICAHMEINRKPNGFWTKERCATEAAKYKTRGKFRTAARSAYAIARRNRWLDDVCTHMPRRVR